MSIDKIHLMTNKNKVAVVIPFYKSSLTELEKISLDQCFKVLYDYPLIAIKPDSLDISGISHSKAFSRIVTFEDSCFKNVQSYNALMLSSVFYQRFLNYEFILIYQLDAFVFRDELSQWCAKGYDYIGAPWLKRIADKSRLDAIKTKLKTRFYTFFNISKYGVPSDRQFDNRVGNGGFSLRRVQKFYTLSLKFRNEMQPYHDRTEFKFHEDVFWSIEINRKRQRLKIPFYHEALHFSFENNPERSIQLTENQLPFGCHAWDLHTDFWRPYFENLGFQIPLESQS